MKEFKHINRDTITEAEIGDIFTGYGLNGYGVKMEEKSITHNIIYACFRELKKDGADSKFYFEYCSSMLGGGIKDRHRDHYSRR